MKKADYGRLSTEQTNPSSKNIDRVSVKKILRIMDGEDAALPRAVAKANPQIVQAVGIMVSSIKKGGRIFFAGAGTSGRLGVLEAAECPPTFNTPPSLVQAVMAGGWRAVFRSQEGAEDRRDEAAKIFEAKLRAGDVLIGIAASGVTPFVAGALEAAKNKKARAILVTCNPKVRPGHPVDCLIAVNTGPEVLSGSTRLKAGTATKLVLNRLTVASMIQLGKVYQNWMVDLQPKSKKLRTRAIRLIEHLGRVRPKQAENYLKDARRNVKLAILMARTGWDYQTALQRLRESSGFLQEAMVRSGFKL